MAIPVDKINEFQFVETLDLDRARAGHDYMVEMYQENRVNVHLLEPTPGMTPNQLYCADLLP